MSHGNVVECRSDEEFEALLNSSERPVVVDFTASWCGPCTALCDLSEVSPMVYFHTNFASALWESVTRSGKMIAPVYADLSQQYDNVLFLKVDIDKLTVTAHKNKIRGVPTFQFYQKGAQMTHSFSGGDRAQLERNVQMLAATGPAKQVEPVKKSPFKFFPDTPYVLFDAAKFPQVHAKLVEFNTTLQDSSDQVSFALSASELSHIKNVFDTLEKTSFYHSSDFSREAYMAVLKAVRWPANVRFPALDLLRLFIIHPQAAAFFAAAYRNATDDNAVDIILSYLLEDGLPDACVIMSWRFIANMFKTEALRSVALEAIDQITSVAALEFDKKSENVQAVIGSAMLNMAIAVSKLTEKDDNAFSHRYTVLKSIQSILPNEKRDAKKDMYYAAIGCLLYGFVGLTNEVKLQAKALVSGSSPAATELNALLDKPM